MAEEYLDVLDARGNRTGEKKLRSQIHSDGDWHRVVDLWILNSKGELLIQKRSPNKENWPNAWDIGSAGHISAGENSLTTAMREANEELGLMFTQKDFEYLFTVTERNILNNGTYINNSFADVYLVRIDLDLAKLQLQKTEVSEARWMPYENLKNVIGDKSFVPHPEEYARLFDEIRKRLGKR